MLTVDTHSHIVAADRSRYPLTPYEGRLGEWVEAKPVTTEELLGEMDQAGVDRALLVQASSAYGFENAYVADGAEAFPQRFSSVCIIDMTAPDAADTLTYWVKARGVRGIRLFTTPNPEAPWLDDPSTFPVWERTRELGIPMAIQTNTRHLPRIHKLLQLFPEIRVAFDHLGGVYLEPPGPAAQALLDLAAFPNVYAKFSTVNFYAAEKAGISYEAYFRPIIDKFGPNRMMWGSNYPNTYDRPYQAMVELARGALSFLNSKDQDAVFGGTALALWPELA